MNKTQKIRRLEWALTGGLLLFLISVQPAFSERPKTPRAKTTPAPAPVQDRSDFGGDANDDVSAGQMETITQQALENEKAIAVLPPGPERERRERDRQQFVGQSDAVVDGCTAPCPSTLTNGALMAARMGEALKSPEFTAKAHGLADRAVSAAEQATNDPKQTDKLVNALTTRGAFLEKAGEYERAHADAKYALKVKPGDKAALGLLNLTKDRVRAGAAPVPTAVQTRPAPPTAVPSPYRDPQVQTAGERALGRQQAINFYNKAKSSNNLNDTARALEYAQAAIRADPSLPDGYMERAKALLGLKGGDRRDQLAQAINDLRSAMELWMKTGQTGRLAEANGLSAKAKNAAGDYKGAHDDADKAVSYNAGYAPAYWERGVAREALKQKELALADYSKSAALLPEVYGAANDEATARLMAPENSAPVARPAESALHKSWTKLLERAGGGLYLFWGAMGAVFVLLAGYVFLFAKEGSAANRFKTRWFTPSGQAVTAVPDEDAQPAQDGPYLPAMRGSGDADGLEGRLVDSGKYRVVCMIGRGGMGTVYKAYDLALNRDVAIKCMNEALLPNERECARFVNEGRVVAKLRHPNIVAVYSLFKEGRRALIVFEHIEGDTLHHMLNESPGRRLEPRRALAILVQLVAAVDYAHGEGVIHRDLKPPNVMVNDGDKVKVMDFGISRVVEHMGATQTKTIVGTPLYMAPEQCDGTVVRQSDVYALGIIAYEMLTGILPFRDMGPMQLDKREGRFPAASALLPNLPAAVDEVFKKVLAPDPEKRYLRGRDFVEALDVALRQATPPGA